MNTNISTIAKIKAVVKLAGKMRINVKNTGNQSSHNEAFKVIGFLWILTNNEQQM
jgi:hypothetical protein